MSENFTNYLKSLPAKEFSKFANDWFEVAKKFNLQNFKGVCQEYSATPLHGLTIAQASQLVYDETCTRGCTDVSYVVMNEICKRLEPISMIYSFDMYPLHGDVFTATSPYTLHGVYRFFQDNEINDDNFETFSMNVEASAISHIVVARENCEKADSVLKNIDGLSFTHEVDYVYWDSGRLRLVDTNKWDFIKPDFYPSLKRCLQDILQYDDESPKHFIKRVEQLLKIIDDNSYGGMYVTQAFNRFVYDYEGYFRQKMAKTVNKNLKTFDKPDMKWFNMMKFSGYWLNNCINEASPEAMLKSLECEFE